MSYRFVQSYTDLGPARGPRGAVVWHMAEGGNTVAYLSKPNPNDVSVHFVVEYDGDVVQMLRLDHMQTSIRTTAIRTTDDADGFYGATAARRILGPWADTDVTLGPNHASIAVEVEGFAQSGPNLAQTGAIVQLATYLGIPGHLGHRDFASYKACPGRRFPWTLIGGHATEDGDVRQWPAHTEPTKVTVKGGTVLYKDLALTIPGPTLGDDREEDYYGAPIAGVRLIERVGLTWFVHADDVVPGSARPACPPLDCSQAIAEDRAKAYVAWEETP